MQEKRVPPWGTVYRSEKCKDDHANMVVYDQPPRGGATITLQGPAVKSFKDAEDAFYRKTSGTSWRPGVPPKFERRDGTLFRPIYLTGSIAIEHGEHLIRERQFPGRQGRIAFVILAVNRHRSIHRDELLGAIWPDDAPAQTDSGLDAILSKLRGVLILPE